MKKIISAFLSLVLVIGIITSVPITVKAASGSDYTSSSALAAKLNQVFSGDIDIFSNSACTTEVSMPVGTSMSNSTQYWVKSNTTGNTCSGWQCYIYANAVYNKLFNEWVGHGDSFSHSQNVITAGKSSVSYSDFANAGVHTGAYIRTTNQSSGAYNGSSGHSMIVLSYDSSNITYLEGNGDGNGAIRITTKTWSAFNTAQLSGKSRYICHVVQPTESYYQSLYQTTPQTYTISYNANGGIGAPASQTKTHGVALKLSTTIPTRKGYTLWGWSYTPTGTPPAYSVGGTFEMNANTTLYAIWKPNTYTVVYNGNGNTGGSTVASSHQYCDSFVTSSGEYYVAYEFMQTGHDLSPVIDSGGIGKYLIEFDLYSDVAGKTRVYAQNGSTSKYGFWQEFETTTSWKHYSFYVDVYLQDESVSQSMLAFYGEYGTGCNPHVKNIVFTKANENLSANGFTRTGYSFLGWSTNPNATISTYTDKQAIKNLTSVNEATLNLFAIWKPENYIVTFDDNDGDDTDSMSIDIVTYNSTFGELPIPTRSGYTFNGWYTAPTGGTRITSSTVYTTAGGITLYAQWTKNHTHSYTGTVTKSPSCTETGVRTYKCSCGASYTQTISATGHIESSWITNKKATVYSDGEKYKECTECGEILETATIKQLKCSKPKLSKISNTSSGVKISWGKVSGADTYRVYRKTKNGSWKYLGSTSKTSYTDKTAKSGTKYYYAVRARNEAGNSSLSSSLSKYYLADPTLKTPKSTKNGVSLKWTKTTGAQGYIIYRKTGNGSYKKLKTEKGVSNLSYVDKSAKKGKKYTYKVKAYYSKTYSAYSNTKTIKDKY